MRDGKKLIKYKEDLKINVKGKESEVGDLVGYNITTIFLHMRCNKCGNWDLRSHPSPLARANINKIA